MRLHAAEPDDNAEQKPSLSLQLRTGILGDDRMQLHANISAIASGR